MKEILSKAAIQTQVSVFPAKKEKALKKIANLLAGPIGLNEEVLKKGLLTREEEGTTGFTDGFAIPHAKLAEITDTHVGIVTFKRPINWESLDGQKIEIAIILLTPSNDKNNPHLQLLSQLSRKLMDAEFVKQIKANLADQDALYRLVGNIVNQ